MFNNKTPATIRASLFGHALDDRIPMTRTMRLVAIVLERGAEPTSTADLVAAFHAARTLAEGSGRGHRQRWIDAAEQIEFWLAVRCLCGDLAAVTFINDRHDRVSSSTAA